MRGMLAEWRDAVHFIKPDTMEVAISMGEVHRGRLRFGQRSPAAVVKAPRREL